MTATHGPSRTRPLLLLVAAVLLVGAGFAAGMYPPRRVARVIARVEKHFHPIRAPGWTQFASTDLPRYEALRVIAGDSTIIFSGFQSEHGIAASRVEFLDLHTGRWTRKHDMPQAVTHTTAVLLRDTVWIVGGFEGDHPGAATQRVWRYAIATDSWSPGPPLPAARGGGAVALAGDTLHFIGGWLPDRNTDSHDHWWLAPGDSAWHSGAPLPLGRGHLTAAVVDGAIYVIGGAVGHDPVPVDVSAVTRYDLRTGVWDSVASLPFPVSHVEPSTNVVGGRIVLMGGRSLGSARYNIDDVIAYDPIANQWANLGRIPLAMLAPVAAVVGDTAYLGLGADRGDVPENLAFWKTALRNEWHQDDSMPIPLGEVAAGVIDNKLYLVGSEDGHTLTYDLATGRWDESHAAGRPLEGDHHAAEVLDGKLWLLGDLGATPSGIVQIFDPVANRWTLGPPLPFAAGSCASAVIDGKIYVAGGVVGDSTTAQGAVLDPSTMRWTPIAPMPRPRNHAASATDGKRLFVFGGRNGGNVLADGFNDVQIYDPATNRWTVSDGSTGAPAPLPQGRGGMGKAVWVNGEFWVIGGETADGAGANAMGTYARVDIYDPVRNNWRQGTPLPAGRHGIFPVTWDGLVIVAGGGSHSGESSTATTMTIWPTAR
jgi:N-acetylneuraminic acid mutarotase